MKLKFCVFYRGIGMEKNGQAFTVMKQYQQFNYTKQLGKYDLQKLDYNFNFLQSIAIVYSWRLKNSE